MKTVASLVSSCLCFSVGWIMDMQISKQVEASKWSLNAIMTTRTSQLAILIFHQMFSEPNKRKQKWLFCPPTTPSPIMEGGSLGSKKPTDVPFFEKSYGTYRATTVLISLPHALSYFSSYHVISIASCTRFAKFTKSSFIYLWRSKLPEMLVSSAIPGHFPHHYHCNRHLCHHHLLLGSLPTKEFSSKSSSSRLWSLPSLSGSFGFRDILQIWLRLWWCHHYD